MEDDDFCILGIVRHFEEVERKRLQAMPLEADAPCFIPVLEDAFFTLVR